MPAKTLFSSPRFFLTFAALVALLFALYAILQPRFSAANLSGFVERLKPASGYSVSLLASGLAGARLMALTEKGDVLVSQTGSGRVSLIPLGDGVAVRHKPQTLISGIDGPHGLAIDDGWLYVAAETEVLRYKFDAAARKVTSKPQVLVDGMPSGGHSTRTIAKGPDGWFYVSVGSSCNVCVERHPWRATIFRFKPGGRPEVFATGLRNTVGYDWHPKSGALYGVDNGRDWLGDDLPPGEVNEIKEGGFYGWPYFYGKNVRDQDFGGAYDEAKHGTPIGTAHDFAAHVAPLSLRFYKGLPETKAAAALVAQHGSWNRSSRIGYKVVRLDWDAAGKITQSDFLTGFLQNGQPIGRPVDTLELPGRAVLVSDDYRGVVLLLQPK